MGDESLKQVLERTLAPCRAWLEPRAVKDNPFRLVCGFEPPATLVEVQAAWRDTEFPAGVAELWSIARSATLFEGYRPGKWNRVLVLAVIDAGQGALDQAIADLDRILPRK